MTPEETILLKSLLTTRRVLSLAVIVDGAPLSGLLPFAMQADFAAVLVHASSLAKHTAGLDEGASVSFLIHAADTPDSDPLQLPRLSMQARVAKLAKDSSDYPPAQAAYVARFPSSQPIFGLGDFNLYALLPITGRFVVGFGRALNLTADALRELA